jgi:hypothetical protein
MSTSAKVPLPGNATVYVQGFANAAYSQQVTIQPPSGSNAVFSGSGENNTTLQLTATGFLTTHSGGQPSFKVPSNGGTYTVSVMANNTASQVASAGTSFTTPSGGTIYINWASSEDSSDNDWNDSVLILRRTSHDRHGAGSDRAELGEREQGRGIPTPVTLTVPVVDAERW